MIRDLAIQTYYEPRYEVDSPPELDALLAEIGFENVGYRAASPPTMS